MSSLVLSPHPDDTVFSAYSVLSSKSVRTLTITFFNLSSSTRIGSLPKLLVSPWRTIEDMVALKLAGTAYRHFNLYDFGARGKTLNRISSDLKPKERFGRIFCPLGVGSHPDHVAVREFAILYWKSCDRKPQLWFYEDLPYAALTKVPKEQAKLVDRISSKVGRLDQVRVLMTEEQFKRKMLLCSVYISQRDMRCILSNHARSIAQGAGAPYAEKLYRCALT